MSPTDVDALIEIGDRGYIVVELKRPNAKFPTGQRLALERMVNDFIAVGKKAVLLLAENYAEDPEEDVIVANCKIIKQYNGTWIPPRHETVKDIVEEWLRDGGKIEREESMNSVNLIGRLTADPQIGYGGSSQTAICKFSIAIDRFGKDGGTDYPRIVVFGKQAENCGKYLAKGRKVGISGRIQTGKYQNKNGDTVYTTDVVADRVEFLSGEKGERTEKQTNLADSFEAIDEDVPF